MTVLEETDQEYNASEYSERCKLSKRPIIPGNFAGKIRSKLRGDRFIIFDDKTLRVYSGRVIFPKKEIYQIAFSSVKSIFADLGTVQPYYYHPPGITLEFIFDGQHISLTQKIREKDLSTVVNWDELIEGLMHYFPRFNMKNYEQAFRAYSPILCWHAEQEVADIRTVVTQDRLIILWEESGDELRAHEYGFNIRKVEY